MDIKFSKTELKFIARLVGKYTVEQETIKQEKKALKESVKKEKTTLAIFKSGQYDLKDILEYVAMFDDPVHSFNYYGITEEYIDEHDKEYADKIRKVLGIINLEFLKVD